MAAGSVVSVLAYLGLAVLGWGGVGPFFSHPARVVLTVVLFGLSAAALFTEGNLSPGEREDRGNRWVLWVLGLIGLLLGWLPAYSDRTEIMTIDGDLARWAAVALFAAGGMIRRGWSSSSVHASSGLVAIQTRHELVMTGIHRVIRHPSCLGLILSTLGRVPAFRSGVAVALTAIMILPIVGRIRSEERLLGDQIDAGYQAYRACTWRLIPGLY